MQKLGSPIDSVVLSHDKQLAMIVTNKEQVQIDPISLLSALCSTYVHRCSRQLLCFSLYISDGARTGND